MKRVFRFKAAKFWPFLLMITVGFLPTAFEHNISAQNDVEPSQENDLVTLSGNLAPLATPAHFQSKTPSDQHMEELTLILKIRDRAGLEALLTAQQDEHSPFFHQWLTPDEFGARFGATEKQLARVRTWLQSNGLQVDNIGRGRMSINFSGSVAQLEQTFHTTLNNYTSNNSTVIANATEPRIPRRMGEIVSGVIGLNGFHHYQTHHRSVKQVGDLQPDFQGRVGNLLGPADFGFAYNLTPLYNASLDGSGQSIAISMLMARLLIWVLKLPGMMARAAARVAAG